MGMFLGTLIAQADIFGTVDKPAGVAKFDTASNGDIGLLTFISTLIQVLTVVAGLWVFFQFIAAGYEFISSNGDAGAYNKAKDRILMSVIGIIVVTSAYTIAALVGLLVFGDASFILKPTIPTAGP